MSADPHPHAPDRNLALELVRVTEAAAMGAARWIGRGDKNAADQARRRPHAPDDQHRLDAGRRRDRRGREGRGADALQRRGGRRRDAGRRSTSPSTRSKGTRLTALGMPSAISVIAVAERGSMFFPGAALYMDKIAVGPEAADAIDIDASPTENVRARRRGEGHASRTISPSSCSSATATTT